MTDIAIPLQNKGMLSKSLMAVKTAKTTPAANVKIPAQKFVREILLGGIVTVAVG